MPVRFRRGVGIAFDLIDETRLRLLEGLIHQRRGQLFTRLDARVPQHLSLANHIAVADTEPTAAACYPHGGRAQGD